MAERVSEHTFDGKNGHALVPGTRAHPPRTCSVRSTSRLSATGRGDDAERVTELLLARVTGRILDSTEREGVERVAKEDEPARSPRPKTTVDPVPVADAY
jgi:hypothetical protein